MTPRLQRTIAVGVGTAVTLFWLGMMFSLVKDRILPQRRERLLAAEAIDTSRLTQNWQDQEEYSAAVYAGTRVGAAATRILRTDGVVPGYRADFRLGMNINVLGVRHDFSILGLADLDQSFELVRFFIRANFRPLYFKVTGLAQGSNLYIEIYRKGVTDRLVFELERRISLLEAVRPVATRTFEIKPGNSITVPVVDPIWSMQRGLLQLTVRNREKITVSHREVDAFRVEARLNEYVTKMWVDDKGDVLKRQLAGELVLERTTAEQASALVPSLDENVEIPRLKITEFADVKPQKLGRIADQKASPLSILDSFAR